MAGLETTPEMFDLRMSEEARPLFDAVTKFIEEEVNPHTQEFFRLGEGREDRWGYGDGQLELLDSIKAKAKEQGLWNFFLPDAETGEGLKNLDYAYIATELGKNPIASESLNCSAPDTGNMEVLERVGTQDQKDTWLTPLLNGEIRSAFAMTEPAVASSDATNICSSAVLDGDEYVINGEKWWTSGAGDPRCKVLIFMCMTNPENPKHQRQSQIIVPMDTPGIKIEKMMHVFGYDDAPHGHGRVSFKDVRVPKENLLLGEGRGFEISQGRLGPGRIHHCMRTIGVMERALELMIKRAESREAFGKKISTLGANYDYIAESRIDIDTSRLLTLNAAHMMDTVGNKIARSEIAQIKVHVPIVACRLIDRAIQMHGGGGVSQDFPLASMYAHMRTLRLADGPDEVHRRVIAREELAKYADQTDEVVVTRD